MEMCLIKKKLYTDLAIKGRKLVETLIKIKSYKCIIVGIQ